MLKFPSPAKTICCNLTVLLPIVPGPAIVKVTPLLAELNCTIPLLVMAGSKLFVKVIVWSVVPLLFVKDNIEFALAKLIALFAKVIGPFTASMLNVWAVVLVPILMVLIVPIVLLFAVRVVPTFKVPLVPLVTLELKI